MKIVIAALALLVVGGCHKTGAEAEAPKKEEAVVGPTALLAVVVDPVRFHGKIVRVTGFYRHGFEVSGLFPSRDLSFSEANGLWLDSKKATIVEPPMSDAIWDGEKPLLLQVEGVIDANSHGHLGAWTGTIHAKTIRAYPVAWLDDRTK